MVDKLLYQLITEQKIIMEHIDWIKKVLLNQEKNISPEDLDLISIVDTAEEAVAEINDFYKNYVHKPNF